VRGRGEGDVSGYTVRMPYSCSWHGMRPWALLNLRSSMKSLIASMKMRKKLLILPSVIFALSLFAGCRSIIATQDGGKTAPPTLTAIVSTFAGSTKGFADGIGRAAQFDQPHGIALDATGNLYVSDSGNNRIRKITPTGEVSTFAGSGVQGFADGVGSAAQFHWPWGIAIDAAGNLYISDNGNNRIRKITPAGEVSTLAGSTWGDADGTGSAAQFKSPLGIAIDATGNLYVADSVNSRIRKITPAGEVSTLAGSTWGDADGTGSAAQFVKPHDIAIDGATNLYVTDLYRIRKVTPAGEVTTIAGSGEQGFDDGQGSAARFRYPGGIAIDTTGNFYVVDTGNKYIRKVTPAGEVVTLHGTTEGYADSAGNTERFEFPWGIVMDSTANLYVVDSYRIRKMVME